MACCITLHHKSFQIAGKVACANVLSDLYAMGVTECDNMLMLLAVSTKMTEKERDVVIPLVIFRLSLQFINKQWLLLRGQIITLFHLVCIVYPLGKVEWQQYNSMQYKTTATNVGTQNFRKLKLHRFKFKAVEMYVRWVQIQVVWPKKVCELAEIRTAILSNQAEDLSKRGLRLLGCLAEDNSGGLLNSRRSLGSN